MRETTTRGQLFWLPEDFQLYRKLCDHSKSIPDEFTGSGHIDCKHYVYFSAVNRLKKIYTLLAQFSVLNYD